MSVSIVLCLAAILVQSLAHREHKVHNIVLYPDKQSWCKTTAIKQVVTSAGYRPTTIDNNVCVGACFSYSIPRTQPAEPGELIVPYCDSCQPAATRCYHVKLYADDDTDGARSTQKRVQIITNCTCLSCEKKPSTDCELSDENTAELPVDLFADLDTPDTEEAPRADDVPELLSFIPDKARDTTAAIDPANVTKEQKYELNSKLIGLLRSIQEQEDGSPNFNYDKAQLRDLLKIIEGSEARLSDKNLMEFVNFVNIYNSEDLELDLSRLKEVLTNFQAEQQQRHHNYGHNAIHDADKHHAKHHIGEEQKLAHVGVGRLVMGPRHSFVLEEVHPSGVEEKLNVEPHMLKPNHAGTVVSYENHDKV